MELHYLASVGPSSVVTVSGAFLVCAALGSFGDWPGILENTPPHWGLSDVYVMMRQGCGFGRRTLPVPVASGHVLPACPVPETLTLLTWLRSVSGSLLCGHSSSPLWTILFRRKPLSTAHT